MDVKQIEKTILKLGGVIQQESMDAAEALVSAIKDTEEAMYLIESLEKRCPDEFSCWIQFLNDVKEFFIRYHLPKSEAFYKTYFVFLEYNFIEAHLRNLIEPLEGTPCISDKTRTIARAMSDYCIEGKEIKFDYKGRYTYHLPRKILKTQKEIMSLHDALFDLHGGRPRKYLEWYNTYVLGDGGE